MSYTPFAALELDRNGKDTLDHPRHPGFARSAGIPITEVYRSPPGTRNRHPHHPPREPAEINSTAGRGSDEHHGARGARTVAPVLGRLRSTSPGRALVAAVVGRVTSSLCALDVCQDCSHGRT
ncbi:hypothetical protein GCM10023222_08730 [Saccharopolyspora cebuensis]